MDKNHQNTILVNPSFAAIGPYPKFGGPAGIALHFYRWLQVILKPFTFDHKRTMAVGIFDESVARRPTFQRVAERLVWSEQLVKVYD